MHMQKITIKGQFIQKIEWKQTDGRNDCIAQSVVITVFGRRMLPNYTQLTDNIHLVVVVVCGCCCIGRAKTGEAKPRDTPDVIRDVDGARKTAAAAASSADKLSDDVKGDYINQE